MPSILKSTFSSALTLAVVGSLAVGAATPTQAAVPDAATTAVTELFDRLANDFVPQVASSTSLAEQLPTLAVTPAGSVELKTAFGEALGAGGPLAGLSGATTLVELRNYINGATGDGWTFTSPTPTATSLIVGFTRIVDRQAGLDIRDQDGTLSLSTGTGIDVRGTLRGSFTLAFDPTTEQASLIAPSLSIETTADLRDGVHLDAGLGILGVEVVGEEGEEDYHLSSTVDTVWANPDNDAAKSLAYDTATPGDDGGELAADGAGSGLVTATRTGSLAGELKATPRPTTLMAGLPDVGATVTLTSATPATFEAPSVTADVPVEAEPFLTLTPRDLAAGLSQAASAIIGMQDAEDTQLPLMRGSIGNAVDAVGGIKEFLADQVPDADPTDPTPGQPKFASLQDMLNALDAAKYDSGWTIDILKTVDDAPSFNANTFLADFTVVATRGVVENIELNPLGAPTTGTGTYSDTGLTAPAAQVDFDGPDGVSGPDLVGRKVTAGESYGTIKSVDSESSLTLTPDGWSAGTPTNGTTFAIEAADPKTGAPELAGTLAAKTGIAAANADLSTALVTPRVTTVLPMVLDLSAPLTYVENSVKIADCDPDPTKTAPCPFKQVDASGLGRVITSLPLASDRFLLRRSVGRQLLVADADISSPVQISTTSGFLGLSIGGTVELTAPGEEHLQVLELTEAGDIAIPAFVEKVRQQAAREPKAAPTKVFTRKLGGSVRADLVVTVDDAPDAFGEDDSTAIVVSGSVADLAADTAPTVAPADTERAALLKALNFDADNPTSLFGGVQAALEGAGSDLTTMTGGGLDTPIPLVGSSIGQLIGAGASGADGVTYTQDPGVPGVDATAGTPAVEAIPATTTLTDDNASFDEAMVGRQIVVGSTTATIVDQTDTTLVLAPQLTEKPEPGTPYLVENELLGAVHVLQAMTPATLQETIAMAQASLGNGSTIDFGLVGPAANPQLRLDLTWKREYGVSRPVSLTLGEGQDLVGAGGGGELSIAASGTVKLGLLLPLSKEAMLDPIDNTLVDESSSEVDFNVAVAADDAYFGAAIGPISVDVGKLGDEGSFAAGFGVNAVGGTGEATPSIADFFSNAFTITVTNGKACTGEGEANDVLCATFPVYVSGASAGDLTINSTLGTGDSLSDVFTGTSTKVGVPEQLEAILAGKPFEFGTLSEGLKQYLFYAEAALRTASNNGEMPVIGKDLQAGADFMGVTRENIDKFIEAEGDVSTVGPARDYLTKKLSEVLDIPLNGPQGIQVGFTCNTYIEPPPAPTMLATAPTPAATDKEYVYQVVSTYKDPAKPADTDHDSAPSEMSEAVTNAATLSATSYNTVTWVKAAGATEYKILRATQTTPAATAEVPEPVPVTSAFVLVGRVAGTLATYRDVNPTGSTYPAAGQLIKPYRTPAGPCEDTDSVTEIEGVTLGLTLGQGVVSPAKGCVDGPLDAEGTSTSPCLGGKLAVDLGLPGLSLKTGESGSVSGKVGWSLKVSIGMSRTRGFYINTGDPENPADAVELEIGAALKLDRAGDQLKADNLADLTAQLSIIDVDVEKRTDTPEFVGHFGIDLKDSADAGTDLKLAEMASLKLSDAIVVSVNAKVNIDWHLEASADSAMPGVSTNLLLTWSWGASTAATPPPKPAPAGAPKPTDVTGLKVKFNNVTLNTGEFFGEALKPYMKQLVDATKPLQPVIDTIFTPMPVISDLSKAAGGKAVTIASLAETFNTLPGGPQITPFLDGVKTIKALTNVKCSTSCGVEIGSFELARTRVATTSASPATAGNLVTAKEGDAKAASNNITAKDTSGNLSSPATPTAPATPSKLASLKKFVSIPVIEDPTILFDLISGGDIALVEFDSGPLSLGFQFQKSFGPIYAPPPVMMVIGGGASVTLRIAAGFDTYGIRRAMETGDGAEVLDSLYFKTVDSAGRRIPVVQFTGYLEAGASVSIGILEVGVLGGIKLTVGFYWNDPNNDGKFRLFEFSGAVATNPICLFNVGGELSLYIKIFVVIGFSPFAVDFDFTLVNIKLLDFNLKPDCTPPPPRLAGKNGTVLYLFAGRFGGEGPRGHVAWAADNKDETWVVRQVPGYKDGTKDIPPAIEVRGLGLTESFPDNADGTAITAVVLDGRDYTGNLTISFTGGSAPVEPLEPPGAFTKTAVVIGGSGDDVILTGEGDSWVDSGVGSDLVTTLDRTDLSKPTDPATWATANVAGGPGPDSITVGNGNDTVTGDGSLKADPVSAPISVSLAPADDGTVGTTTLADPINTATLALPSDAVLFADNPGDSGADQIAAGLGRVRLSGNGGTDTIGTANDNTLADSVGIKAGTAGGSPTTEALYRALPSVLVGGAGGDMMKSGSADDAIYTGSYATIGESGTGAGDAATDTNTVDTGVGSDTVYGSNGLDFVTTGSTSGQTAKVYGGDGPDVLTGGLGTDEIYGGPGDDYVVASPATVGAPGSASDVFGPSRDVGVLPGAGSQEKLLVGGTGSDRIYGADGPSTIFGDTMADACDTQAAPSDPVSKQPDETTVPGDADDLILGGNGIDVVNAGGGTDWVYASGAADAVCGNSGTDRLYGGDEDDLINGGSGADQGFGEDGVDQVYGNDGDDSLYGAAGADRIQGNTGSDWLDGGTDADVLLGGTSKAGTADVGDVLLGAEGDDVLVGDNAQTDDVTVSAPYPTDLGSSDGSFGGNDYLVGGDEDDAIYGGLGDDAAYGGTGDDYAEGNPGTDRIRGEADDDDVLGGSSQVVTGLGGSEAGRPDSNDFLYGGAGQDVMLGDNGSVTRPVSTGVSTTFLAAPLGSPLTANRVDDQRAITPYDLGDRPASGLSGADTISGDADNDVLLGQGGNDSADGGSEDDYAEGGQGSDLVLGGSEDDDIVGGSFTITSPGIGQPDGADNVYGGSGSDLAIGDNGLLTRMTTSPDWRTVRANAAQTDLVPGRGIALFDLDAAALTNGSRSAPDSLSGQDGVDVLLGQDGTDRLSGGDDDDYVEGEGGADIIHGDEPLPIAEIVAAGGSSAWATPLADGPSDAPGQDDLTGGSSRSGFRDGSDVIRGDGDDDFVVGDNGSIARVVDLTATSATDRVYTQRYGTSSPTLSRLGNARVRVAGGGATSTRFCAAPSNPTASSTCEVSGSWGNDLIYGDAGQDVLYGQDGADKVWGGADDDDLYGELGADLLYGEDGEDAILGDRGGVRNRYEDGTRSVSSSLTQPPAVTYRSRLAGSVSRETDLLHDVNGVDFVGGATTVAMPLDGITYGGVDRIRGGPGRDSIHAGAGDDLVNGDSGGDTVFGGRGKDVLWGGLGQVCVATDTACLIAPGTNGEFIDHLAGGKDEDVIDWRPRGVYTGFAGPKCSIGTTPTTTKKDGTTDPCSWFEMTDRADDTGTIDSAANNQHHQGVDWIYGGWDRDVMQGDLSQNGPNEGDRLIDWSGVYNLYSHCNAAYGGYNDVRIPNPALEKFLREWATGLGAGRPAGTSPADVESAGTSAYDELALVNNADGKGHGTGSAYPSTPGHFDDAGACGGF